MSFLWFTGLVFAVLHFYKDKEEHLISAFVIREMQAQTDLGGRLEEEWHSKLHYYQSKYPEEAAEFKLLLADGLLPGWESSLPVKYASTLYLLYTSKLNKKEVSLRRDINTPRN